MLRLSRESQPVIATSTDRPTSTERDAVLHNLVSTHSYIHPHGSHTLTQQDRRRERDDRDRRERRRSRSPAAIDRYQPDRLPVTTTTVAMMIATIAVTAAALRPTAWELAPSIATFPTSPNLQHRLSTLCQTL